MNQLDSSNEFEVVPGGETVRILKPPTRPLTRMESVRLAAWIVVTACGEKEFWQMVEQISRSPVSTNEGHRFRHQQLHRCLDELSADWIEQTGSLPSEQSVLDLIKWSHQQTIQPTQKT